MKTRLSFKKARRHTRLPPEKILILFASPSVHGFGHFRRCAHLRRELNNLGYQTRSRVFSQESISRASEINIIIDARDVSIQQANEKKRLVFLDNQSKSKPANSTFFDTLPHFNHSQADLYKAMSFFIGSIPFPSFKPRPMRSKLLLVKKPARISPQKPYKDFQKDLIRTKNKLSGYYGQALFESLLAGKRFCCQNLTPYHWTLSVHLKRELNVSKRALSLLDGKGAARLAKAISSAVKQP